jgi:hypothetical protein
VTGVNVNALEIIARLEDALEDERRDLLYFVLGDYDTLNLGNVSTEDLEEQWRLKYDDYWASADYEDHEVYDLSSGQQAAYRHAIEIVKEAAGL